MEDSKNDKSKNQESINNEDSKKYKNFLDTNYFKANENGNSDSSSSNKRAKKELDLFL